MEQLEVTLESSCFLPNSKISDLLNKLRIMFKKPTIESDISQVLDEFLQKLNECDKYLEHGIFNMNFAEAALLLQSSADIYSKKVDLLWDIIFDYQKRILLNDEKNSDKGQEMEKLEERRRKYKRKRKTNETEQQSSKLVHSFSFGATDYVDYLNATYEHHDLLNEWEKFTIPPQPKDKISSAIDSEKYSLFLPNTPIYTEDNEYIGKYNQFHSAELLHNFFMSETHSLQENERTCRTMLRINIIDNHLVQPVPISVPSETYSTKLSEYLNSCVESQSELAKDKLSQGHQDQIHTLKKICRDSCYVSLERLPLEIVQKNLRRLSFADSLFDDDNFSSVSENCSSPSDEYVDHNENHVKERCDTNDVDPVTGTIEKRNKSCSQDSAFYELDDDEEQMDNDGINTPLPENVGSIVDKQPCFGGSIIIPRTRMIKRKSFIDVLKTVDLEDEKIKKRKTTKHPRRISEKVLKRLSTGITVNLKEFERFCRAQYKPAENEGQIPPESDSSSDEEDSSDSSDEEETNEHFMTDYGETIIEEEIEDETEESPETTRESQNVESINPPPFPTTSIASDTQVSRPFVEPATTTFLSDESRKIVREWRDFMIPKLKCLENKSDFDIHEYGSNIMAGSEVGEERSFRSIVRGKGAAEMARYFLAALQLATTNNVEIMGAVPGKLANETFKIKTLDKTRYHELLEEYQAPSEETFRDRLEKAQAMNPKLALYSTPSAESPKKRIKLANYSKKKLF